MYRFNAKILFLGITMSANTMKHVIETRVVEHYLEIIKDEKRRAELLSQVMTFETRPQNIWCYYNSNSEAIIGELKARGILKCANCGEAEFILFEAKPFCDTVYELLISEPEKHFSGAPLRWIQDCLDAAK